MRATARETTSVRLDRGLIEKMEAVRDSARFPSQSDFIREALRRMIREERRNRMREQAKALAGDPEDVKLSLEIADWDMEGWAERLEKADRGEF